MATDLGEGGVVMMDVDSAKYFGLEEVGARIWALLAEPRTVDEMVDDLMTDYDVAETICRTEVNEFVGELLGRDLVRPVD